MTVMAPTQSAPDIGPPSAIACQLCGSSAALQYRGHPGYQAPTQYDIYYCPSCDAKFVQPLESSSSIYDLIYRNIENVRGYARYARFARAVRERRDPLAYLADEEDVYWGIAEYLSGLQPTKAPRILEVGSGLGYLTYAIYRRGYDIRGLDISEVAVSDARARFGDLYDCGDLFSIAAARENVYDTVIMTELIEHIPDPMTLLSAAMRLVKVGGDLVLTTPNKSASPAQVLWDTDSPPVHLWWFSEKSMATIAERLDATLKLIDFTEFNRTHDLNVRTGPEMAKPSVPAAFDAHGGLVESPNPLKAPVRRVFFALGLDKIRRAAERRRSAARAPSQRRQTLCAVLTKHA
jgi:2-polyprenyl-3-methyl-5-hydroxy-6-metoxy-1,4-benzoquinol methylase